MWIPLPLLAQLSELVFSHSTGSSKYPGHQVLHLNDGTVIPSPAFGVGSALYQKNATTDVLMALKNGYRHIDNARIYGNEASVGAALSHVSSVIPRSDLYITTKLDLINNATDVRAEFEDSIRDLGVDYVDLYLVHFPEVMDRGGGYKTVWRAMERLVEEGKAKSIGVSNFDVAQLTKLLLIAKIKPSVNQIRYHAYNAQEHAAVLALAKLNSIVIEAYGSLAPITKSPGGPADAIGARIADRISTVSGGIKVTVGQAILDWLRTKKLVCVTTSSQSFRQREQLEVFKNDFPLWADEEVVEYETAGPGWDKK